MGSFGERFKSLRLHRHQLSPFEIYSEDAVDGLLRGLVTQSAQAMDAAFSSELTERLFQADNETRGLDLVSLNLQRGRDHGLPPYDEYRRLCGLHGLRSWRDLTAVVQQPEVLTVELRINPTNNALLKNFQLSSDAEILLMSTKRCQTCKKLYAVRIYSN